MAGSTQKAIKSGIWYTLSNFLVQGVAYLSSPLFNRMMTKQAIGDYANFTSWLSILSVVFTGELFTSVAVARFEFWDDIDDYIASNLLLGTLLSSVISGVIFLFKPCICDILGFSELEFYLLIGYCMVYPASQMFQVKRRITYRHKPIIALSFISTLLPTGVSLGAVFFCNASTSSRLLGFYVPLLLIDLFVYIYLLKQAKRIKVVYWKYGLAISMPLVVHRLSSYLLNSCDRVMIRRMSGEEELANYSVSYTCAMIVSLLWYSLNSAWAPFAYEQMQDENYEAIKKGAIYILIGFGIIVALVMLFAPEILLLFGGKGYVEAVQVIPPVMAGYTVQAVYSFYVNIETYSKKQKSIALNTSVAAVVNIVLNYIFIPRYGYIAAAYTTLAGYIILWLLHFFRVRLLNRHTWYSTRFNCIFVVVFIAYSLACSLVYRVNIVRYILIGILFIAIILYLLKEKDLLKEVIKKKSLMPIICKYGKK